MKLTTIQLKRLIKEELQTILKENEYQKMREMEEQISLLITEEHINWWLENGGPLIDHIKRTAYNVPAGYGKSHVMPLRRGSATSTWKEFYGAFPDLRPAANQIDPQNAGSTITGLIATAIKKIVG